MAVSDFTDEVQVKVYRSHVKIPVIFLVPLTMLATLYCVVYFYANSNWFVDDLPGLLGRAFPGSFEVRELVVEPSLSEVHVYGAQIRDEPGARPAITAPEAHATVEPAFLLVGRLVFSKGRAKGAHVRLVFDEQGEMNLLQALGIDPPDRPVPESKRRPLEIAFRSLEADDCSFEMVQPDFDFRVPDVDVEQYSITIGKGDLQMSAPQVEVPTVDFRFRPRMFGFEPDYGDWRFQVEDVDVDRWRWSDDGFRVDHVSFYAEGAEVEAEGRMGFPNEIPDEPEMNYRGRGEVSIPYWSPLVQYFVRDSVHFDVPEIQVAAEGTLELVDGRVRARADVLNAAGLVFTDLRGEARLRNQYVTLDHAEADFYGGRVEADWAYFDMFDVSYGGAGRFRGVNPAAMLRDYDVSLPALSGAFSGGFEAHGAVPMGAGVEIDDPMPTLTDAMRELAEVEVTDPWVFQPSKRSSLPVDRMSVQRGGRVAVDYERVEVPNARIRAPNGSVDVEHFELDYERMEFTAPGRAKAVEMKWRLPEVRPWVEAWGGEGISGTMQGALWADGPLAAPRAGLQGTLENGRIQAGEGEIEEASGRLHATVDEGRLALKEASLQSDAGGFSATGRLDFARVHRGEEGPEWIYRRSKPVEADWQVRELDLEVADRIAGTGLEAQGALDASGSVDGTLGRPRASFSVSVPRGEVRWLKFRRFALEGGLEGRELTVESLRSGLGESGSLSAEGDYNLGTGAYEFEGRLVDLELATTKYLGSIAKSYRPRGTLNLELHGDGSLEQPHLAGDVELRNLHVGERSLGDVALVANTVEDTFYVSGAALPIGTLVFELPFAGDRTYHARFGVEHLDFARVFPSIGKLDWVESLESTGVLEVNAAADLSRYVVSVDMSSVRLETPKHTIKTKGPLLASLDSNNRLQIERASVGSRGHYVDLRGALLLDSLLTSLRVEGELDLALVDLLGNEVFPGTLPESLADTQGVVDVAVDVGGPPSRPVADGSLTVRRAKFELRDFATPLRLDRGHIVFDRDAVRVPDEKPLGGEFLGGVFNVSGRVDIEDYQPRGARIELWSHNLVYRVPKTANVTFDTDLTVEADELARPSTWMVTGGVEILSARYYRNISLFEEQVAGRVVGTITRRTERYEAGVLEQYPWLSEIGFDVRLRARDGFVIDNKIDRFAIDLEFRFDLRLQRTLKEPRLAGEVDVVDGTVQFQGETFEVRTGTLEYTGDARNPRVEITAGADIRNQCVEQDAFDEVGPSFQFAGDFEESRGEIYHVLLRVEGRLETLNIQFESNPYADQRDILSLMLTGCTVDELSASGATQPTLEIALGPLLGRLEREVRDVVKLSEFTIMPGVERTQVRIADRLSRRLQWRFQLDTGVSERSGGQRYQLEYQLSDRWSAEFSERSSGQRENFLLDAKLKYRVPID